MTAYQTLGDAAPPASTPEAEHDVARAWRRAGIALALAALTMGVLFWPTLAATVRTWAGDKAFTHAFLIPMVSGYLIWDRRHLLARLSPKPSVVGLAVVAVGALGWFFGESGGALVVQQFSVVLIIQGLVLSILGWRVSRQMLFPLAYLYFAVPFGLFLVPDMQDLVAEFVVRALRIFGIPVFLDGTFITIPTSRFEVSEACAGLRYLIASLALGVLFANIMYRSWGRRLAFVALSIIVPLVANWIRALGIVLLAYVSNNKIAIGFDHIIYGWVFYTFVTILLLAIGMTFRERLRDFVPGPGLVSGVPGSFAAIAVTAILAIGIAGTGPLYAAYGEQRARVSAASAPELARPAVSGSWRLLKAGNSGWQPRLIGADRQSVFGYADDTGEKVQLAIAYYGYQRVGAEVVNFANTIEVDPWKRTGGGRASAPVDGSTVAAQYTRLVGPGGARLVWQWYWVDGVFTGNPYFAKLLQVRARLLGGNEAAAYIAIAADYAETPEEATAVMRRFLDRLEPLGPYLDRLAGG